MLASREPGPSHSSAMQFYAQVTRGGKQPKLEFCIGGATLKPYETVFQAVRQVSFIIQCQELGWDILCLINKFSAFHGQDFWYIILIFS